MTLEVRGKIRMEGGGAIQPPNNVFVAPAFGGFPPSPYSAEKLRSRENCFKKEGGGRGGKLVGDGELWR